jgi:hypothetical protein
VFYNVVFMKFSFVAVILRELEKVAERTCAKAALTESVNETQKQRRRVLCAALFDAYSSLSCCYLSPRALADTFLPGI